jgi:hypothetical protein
MKISTAGRRAALSAGLAIAGMSTTRTAAREEGSDSIPGSRPLEIEFCGKLKVRNWKLETRKSGQKKAG